MHSSNDRDARAREVLLGILREVAEPEDIAAAVAGEWRSVQMTGDDAIRAMLAFSDAERATNRDADEEQVRGGWIVTDAEGQRFRTWRGGMPEWTDRRDEATRYFARSDANAVHEHDDDAWRIVRFDEVTTPSPSHREQDSAAIPVGEV